MINTKGYIIATFYMTLTWPRVPTYSHAKIACDEPLDSIFMDFRLYRYKPLVHPQ